MTHWNWQGWSNVNFGWCQGLNWPQITKIIVLSASLTQIVHRKAKLINNDFMTINLIYDFEMVNFCGFWRIFLWKYYFTVLYGGYWGPNTTLWWWNYLVTRIMNDTTFSRFSGSEKTILVLLLGSKVKFLLNCQMFIFSDFYVNNWSG